MVWNQIGLFANVVLTIAYLAIARSILLPLARTGQLWRNRLGFSTGLIFFTCGIGHVIHVEHTARLVLAHGWMHGAIDWHLGLWDSLTAMCAIAYWRQRQMEGPPVDTGTLFEDLQRRQKELETQALEAHLREELAVERELAARQSFALAFDSAPNGMAFVDRAACLVRVNGAFADIVGRTVEDLTGVCLEDLLLGPDGPLAPDSLAAGNPIEVRLERTDGPTTWARLVVTTLADASALLVQLEDVTERRRAQARLNHLALHDPLTRLPNRLLFHDRTRAALLQRHALARLDGVSVHRPRQLQGGQRLAGPRRRRRGAQADRRPAGGRAPRPGTRSHEWAGTSSACCCRSWPTLTEATGIAERIIEALDGYVEIDGMLVTTGASIGVAVVRSGDGATSETLVRDADAALYRAKGSGRGHHVVFDEAIRDDAERRLWVEAELRRGIGDGEITVAYQPQWSMSRQRIVGVEALARWQHPTLGERQPAEFLAVAVETGLIVELGREVLDQALSAFARWRQADPDLDLAVNLSSRQLGRPHFVDEVQSLLATAGVPATSLCLELTETDLTALGRSALTTLDDLRRLGIRLAVDDVGTGQSSLTHLVTLPVDVIKIDRSFVEQVHVPGANRAVVEALLSLARTIGVDVVAEGAETQEQLEALVELGCDVIQGYVVSRPVRADAIFDLLRDADPTALLPTA